MTTNTETESLPFIIIQASTPEHFEGLCAVRSFAYSRHAYDLQHVENIKKLDASDLDATHLVAIDKASGQVLGVLRLRSSLENKISPHPDMNLSALQGESFAYADRFGVMDGPHSILIGQCLMKAGYLWVREKKLGWLIASALKSLARRYRRFGLRVLPGAEEGFSLPQHPEKYYGVGARLTHDEALYQKMGVGIVDFVLGTQHAEIAI